MTQQGICKDCAHWDTEIRNNFPDGINLGKCSRVKMFWDCTEWDYDNELAPRKLTKEARGNLAFVQDGSDYTASLITLDRFGCVQFKEKQNEN